MFIATLFAIARKPKYPSTEECIRETRWWRSGRMWSSSLSTNATEIYI